MSGVVLEKDLSRQYPKKGFDRPKMRGRSWVDSEKVNFSLRVRGENGWRPWNMALTPGRVLL